MTLDEYRENWNGSPAFLEEFAQAAVGVEDDSELASAGKAFLKAHRRFMRALEHAEVMLG